MKQIFSVDTSGTTYSLISPSATSVILQSGHASRFPTPGTDQFIVARFTFSGMTPEIIHITGIQNDTLIITRSREDTDAQQWPAGTTISSYLSSATLEGFVQKADNGGHFKSKRFVSYTGQSVFTLDTDYPTGQNALEISINGVDQSPSAFTEVDSKTIALKHPLYKNEIVLVKYLSTLYTDFTSAASVSYVTSNGQIIDLQNYIRSLEDKLAKLDNS